MVTPCLHFVGFRDDAYNRAVRVFGKPHFVHRSLDLRALTDIAPGDTVVFARDKDWDRLVRSWQVPLPPFNPFYDSEQF
jgi:hypothetical protein